jgi:hypothetical protein
MAIAVDKTDLGGASNDAASGSMAFTTSQAVASNGFIVVGGGWYNSKASTVTGVAGGGLTWVVDQDRDHSGAALSSVWMARAQAPAGLATSTTITVSFSTASPEARTISGMSFTGVHASAPLDGTPPAANSILASTSWSTTAATVQADSVIVSVAWSESSVSAGASVTAPATEAHEELNSDDLYGHVMGYYVVPSTASYNIAGTWNAVSCNSVNVSAAYLTGAAADPTAGGFDTRKRVGRERGRFPLRGNPWY